MITITYTVFEKDLGREFTNVKTVRTIEDFRIFAYSLHSGNWSIVKVA